MYSNFIVKKSYCFSFHLFEFCLIFLKLYMLSERPIHVEIFTLNYKNKH